MGLSRPKSLAILFSVALTLVLSGCGERDATGVVADKSYRAAYSWVYVVPCGKSVIPVTQYVPERWSLLVESDDGEVWVPVDETTFHEVEVGDWYGGDSE